METYPHYTLIEPNKSTLTFQEFFNTPVYTIKGYLDILYVQLSLVPFAINGTYGHDHR
jgi:hypothetical protein